MVTDTKSRFICYHIDGSGDPKKTVPIATGYTRDDAQATGVRRTLGACVLDGSIAVQDRTADVNQADFIRLTEFLNLHFMTLDRANRGGA